MSDPFYEDSDLPPRRETFLARYPRNVKLAVTAVLFAVLVLPPVWIHNRLHHRVDGGSAGASPAFMGGEDANKGAGNDLVVESDAHAAALNDQDDRTVKLAVAPDVRVTEDTAEGSLPRRSASGLSPWQVYARPFNIADKRPRIAIVITDLGLARAITDRAIAELPSTVTLSFDAQGPVVGAWGARARQDGHEIILQVPMEPFDYPNSDPGTDTLLTSMPDSDNLVRLLKMMRHASGYVGITTISGSRMTTDSTKFALVLRTLHDRGLMILDARAAPHSVVTDMAVNANVPVATATQRLDGGMSPDELDEALNDLEKTALQSGRAVGILSPTPMALDHLQTWLKNLSSHGIALAPLSATVQ